MSAHPLSRRSLLAAAGGLSLAALTGCGSSSSQSGGSTAGGKGGTLTLLLPGDVPAGWAAVEAQVNKKLQAELGFTIKPQFIPWANYGQQSLLKFTAGESFDTALQARWLNMTQLAAGGSLVELGSLLGGGKYPNLAATIDPKILELNRWSGKLWGLPQINSVARLHHFLIRQDLADKHGLGQITDFTALERYWYTIKEKEKGLTPIGVNSSMPDLLISATPVGWLNPYSWENPNQSGASFTGNSVQFIFAADAKQAGSSRPVPFWEAPGMMDALRLVRKYYLDGLINKNALTVDTSALKSQAKAGRIATTWVITDGLSSADLAELQKNVSGAMTANVMPIRDGVKPHQTFQADNMVVLNVKGQNHEKALQLEDWVSIKDNHDLLSYGIPGKDWNAIGDDKFEALTPYAFPGFALCWRAPLERRNKLMTESEAKWFDWAQKTENFTVDPFAGFVPDPEPVKRENTQVTAAMTKYGNPLFVGAVDVDKGLDDLKRALDKAGLAKLQAEMAKQADAYLKGQ
ncbi:ABC transporter substrate-binding protein [Nonomuraea sp. NPDC050691]|uniref:ABC transporter substrate-binding protein n=1 Tax=Nonomuraea sp. NPDC050691 TaxID=3155661 RepID=UPI0034116880